MPRHVPKLARLLVHSALWLLAAGCERPTQETPVPAVPVVLISIDTLRSDRLPAYGYDGVETPAIDALAADAILFERAYSHCPLTLPSHVSLLTGQLPGQTGVRDNGGNRLAASHPTYLPRLLAEAGYATGAAVSTWAIRGATGMDQAFDVYDDHAASDAAADLWGPERPGAETVKVAVEWLRRAAGKPFFLFFHLYEPHLPYTPPEPFLSRYGATYDAEIAAADAAVGELLAALRQLGLYEDALIVLVSDHGEGLGDHVEQGHGILLYREAIQVPLLLKLPGNVRGGDSVARPVQLVDFVPTVLEVLDLPRVDGLTGGSLLDDTLRPIYAETLYPRLHYGWSDLASLVDGRYHYIESAEPELYDLVVDPAEKNNILRDERGVYRDLRDRLQSYRVPFDAPAEVDPETAEQLAALGYLASGPQRETLADPKVQLAATAEQRRVALGLFRRGDFEQAVPAFEALLEVEPMMVDGWRHLGLARSEMGSTEEALDAFKKALELSRGAPEVAVEVAQTLLALDRLDEARAHAELVSAREPEMARELDLEIGLALVEAGRLELEATEPLCFRVLETDPENALALEQLGLLALERGQLEAAHGYLSRSVASDESQPNAWNLLGVTRFQLRDVGGAIAAWERAVDLDPEPWDALYNLAFTAARAGLVDKARRSLERYIATAPSATYAAEIGEARRLLDSLR